MSRGFGDIAGIAGLALRARGLGRESIEDLLRLMPMSVADWLDEWFENDALKGVLGAAGVMHLCQGPRSGGTAFNFLHHHVGSPRGVFRPPRSNLGRVLRELPGIEIRDDAKVTRILVDAGRVAGVALESGEEIAAPARRIRRRLRAARCSSSSMAAGSIPSSCARCATSRPRRRRARVTLHPRPAAGVLDARRRAFARISRARV